MEEDFRAITAEKSSAQVNSKVKRKVPSADTHSPLLALLLAFPLEFFSIASSDSESEDCRSIEGRPRISVLHSGCKNMRNESETSERQEKEKYSKMSDVLIIQTQLGA